MAVLWRCTLCPLLTGPALSGISSGLLIASVDHVCLFNVYRIVFKKSAVVACIGRDRLCTGF